MVGRAYGFIVPNSLTSIPELRRFARLQVDASLEAAVREILGHDAHEEIHVFPLGSVTVEENQFSGTSSTLITRPLDITYVVAIHNTLLADAAPFYLDDALGARVLPALGGNRPNPSYHTLGDVSTLVGSEDLSCGVTAIRDGKELSRGMSYKWGGLNLLMTRRALSGESVTDAELLATRMGGGKSVNYIAGLDALVAANPAFLRTIIPGSPRAKPVLTPFELFMHAGNARVVKDLGGRYVFAPDMNTDTLVDEFVREELLRLKSPVLPVACLSETVGGSGDPSIVTAEGVYYGMRGGAEFVWKTDRFDDRTISIQGAGKVGYVVIKRILEDGHNFKMLHVADAKGSAVSEVRDLLTRSGKQEGKDFVLHHTPNHDSQEAFYRIPVDLFSPNAAGQILTLDHTEKLYAAGCRVIAGGANNQRHPGEKRDVDAFMVQNKMVYAPDYIINMGGILNVIYERDDVKNSLGGVYERGRPIKVIRAVKSLLQDIFREAQERDLPTQHVADSLVEQHLARYAMTHNYTPQGLLKPGRERVYLAR